MRSSLRTTFVCAASAALILGSAGFASADDVDLTSSTPSWTVGTDGIPTITLDPGQTGSVVLTYVETNPEMVSKGRGGPVWGPGLEGCELKGGQDVNPNDTQLVLGVDDVTDGVIALGADTVVFKDCPKEIDGVVVPETRTLSFTAGTVAGETLVSFDVDAATYAREGAYFTLPDTFRVVVNAVEDEGLPAPAIANKYATAASDIAASCTAKHGSNWRGELDSYLAKKYDGRLFLPAEEYIVEDEVDAFCTAND